MKSIELRHIKKFKSLNFHILSTILYIPSAYKSITYYNKKHRSRKKERCLPATKDWQKKSN